EREASCVYIVDRIPLVDSSIRSWVGARRGRCSPVRTIRASRHRRSCIARLTETLTYGKRNSGRNRGLARDLPASRQGSGQSREIAAEGDIVRQREVSRLISQIRAPAMPRAVEVNQGETCGPAVGILSREVITRVRDAACPGVVKPQEESRRHTAL